MPGQRQRGQPQPGRPALGPPVQPAQSLFRHLHPGGVVHGGVWTALGDSVAAWATFRNMPPMHDFTTIELKLNVFSAAVLGDELLCEARPLHVGRSTAVIEAKIRKGEKPVANLIVTQFVLPGRDPRAERPAPGDYPPGD